MHLNTHLLNWCIALSFTTDEETESQGLKSAKS